MFPLCSNIGMFHDGFSGYILIHLLKKKNHNYRAWINSHPQ